MQLISAFVLATNTVYSTVPLLPKSTITSLSPSSVAVQHGLCWTKSETPKDRFSQDVVHFIEKKALFVFCHGDTSLYELIQFKEDFRSWFVGNSVQHGKSLID